jgi:hypothetical protein
MSTTLSVISITDSISHVPLPGATVFVNGVGAGTSDNQGNVTLTLEIGAQVNVSVKLSGYQTVKASINGGNDLAVNLPPNQTPSSFNSYCNY